MYINNKIPMCQYITQNIKKYLYCKIWNLRIYNFRNTIIYILCQYIYIYYYLAFQLVHINVKYIYYIYIVYIYIYIIIRLGVWVQNKNITKSVIKSGTESRTKNEMKSVMKSGTKNVTYVLVIRFVGRRIRNRW